MEEVEETWPYGPLVGKVEQLTTIPDVKVNSIQKFDTVQSSIVTKQKEDKVNHPKHYTSHPSGVECIEITEHYDFCIGNAIKYLWRQGLKDSNGMDKAEKQIEDCKKAIWYINRHIENVSKSNTDNSK